MDGRRGGPGLRADRADRQPPRGAGIVAGGRAARPGRLPRFCAFAPAILAFLFLSACSGSIEILSYNVENLFDDQLCGREYPEFRDPRWARERYPAKLAAVARAIRASSRRGPDLVALQEVESARALADLRDRHLSGLGYRHLVFVPQPGSAIGVAFLSRLPVLRTRALAVGELDGQPLRHIVEIEVLGRGRRLLVLNNHWKSRSEGDLQTAPGRRRAEEVLARRVRQLLAEDPGVDLVAVGDFNENLEELASWTSQAGFYDPWVELPPRERGSAAFRGAWQTPDHALLAPGLLDERGFFYRRGDFRVLRPAFLLDRGSGLPRRFAAGGASDHLPLVLRLHLAGAP